MTRKKRKPASFDAMVKLFIRNYDIPTRKDIDTLLAKLDRIESLIKAGSGQGRTGGKTTLSSQKGGKGETVAEKIYRIIKHSRNGVGFAEIRSKTGYKEKKVRNTIYRLHNMGRITRKSRGLYIVT
ncbi:MAG: hypothetical protein JRF32_06450 [Deltaproteobacteria bacterium]|nr:hypothetical protein [Deltaproteobacteria bacterium]MBW2176146.1 hypothetical protein [Deltaproteobacteria bacterium]MBW2297230.1 hypothetical protein [Deltaproteobacteria bacterium]MBW2610810.1 hypothetical protein [Deltaproteobacteria bacterium]MBW2633474.1 hypothetical protein [Deltaproteobacteria bacterium]